MKKALNLGVIGIDHGHIFDMLDEMIKEGCSCNYFWTDGDPLTLQEFNKRYPNIELHSYFSKKSNIFQGHLEGKIFEILIFSSKQTYILIIFSFRIKIFRSLAFVVCPPLELTSVT